MNILRSLEKSHPATDRHNPEDEYLVESNYSDTSANEDNSFRDHTR